jgi:hypothetical protein
MDQICETYFPIIILGKKERADSFNHKKETAQFPQSKKKRAHSDGLLCSGPGRCELNQSDGYVTIARLNWKQIRQLILCSHNYCV